MTTETIKAEYKGYTGYAYGVSSFSLRNENNREVFHTGFCRNRPQTQEECVEFMKDLLKLMDLIRED